MLSNLSRDIVMSIGGTNSGIHYHAHGEAWLAVLLGAKQWFLRPMQSDTDDPALVCVQHAKEVLYFPQSWDHATYNMGLTVAYGGQGTAEGIHGLAVLGDVEGLDKVFSEGEDIHLRDQYNLAPIHLAAHGGHTHAMAWLLEHRAAVDTIGGRDSIGPAAQPLHVASDAGHVSAVEWLLRRHSANINAKGAGNADDVNPEGFSALEQAVATDKRGVLEVLLRYGASITRKQIKRFRRDRSSPEVIEMLERHWHKIQGSSPPPANREEHGDL